MEDNPFPGLRPFEAQESHLFFGREAATDDLLKKLRNRRFIAVVGTSGSGKSSLVRAGLLPDLYGGGMANVGSRWRVAIFRPGDAPIRALTLALCEESVLGGELDRDLFQNITEVALRRGAQGLTEVVRQARLAPGENLLIVVDQFEELFRTRQPGLQVSDEPQAFVKLLLQAAGQSELPIYVMLTMRSEYLGECTRFRDLPEAINEGQYLIPRMNRDQRRQAIMGPVSVAGARLSPPLLQRLLNDVGENPDQLPIMQHAMMRTWDIWAAEQQPDLAIDIVHYEATGTMTEALSRHADEIYLGLADNDQRVIAERAFKRLTGLGPDQREMRYPTALAELCAVCDRDAIEVTPVVDAFRQAGRSFLMPPADTRLDENSIIDISHESLIRIWKRLQEWVDEEAQSARIYCRLAEDAELNKQGEQGLRRNPELAIARNWRRNSCPNESWARRYHAGFEQTMAFLDRSKAAAGRRKVASLGAAIGIPLLILGAVAGYNIKLLNQENEEFATALDSVQEQLVINEEVQEVQLQMIREESTALARVPEKQEPADTGEPPLRADTGAEAADVLSGSAGETIEPVAVDALALGEVASGTGEPELSAGGAADLPADQEDSSASVRLSVAETQSRLAGDPSMTLPRQRAAWAQVADLAEDESERLAAQQRIEAIDQSLERSASISSPDNFLTSTDVQKLEPIGVSDQFSPGRVYMLARVNAPRAAVLVVNWLRDDGSLIYSREARVQPNTGRGFRTFNWKTIMEPGHYAVQLLNEERQIIAYRAFTVGSPEAIRATEVQVAEARVSAAETVGPISAFDDQRARLAADPGMTLQRQRRAWEDFARQSDSESERELAQQQIQAINQSLKNFASIASVDNFVTCEDVRRLEPVNVGDQFGLGRVYVLARVHAPKEAILTMNWLREDGTLIYSRESRVQANTGRGFRTFSWKTMTEPGRYAVQLLNENQQVIAYRAFGVR